MSYVYQRGRFYIPSGPNTGKVRNLEKNSKATLVIDDEGTEHGLMVECQTRILSGAGAEPYKKHMREVKKWRDDETTIVIELSPKRKVSWFLK